MNKHRVTHLYNIAVMIWINIVYLLYYYSCNCSNNIGFILWLFVKGEIHKFTVAHINNSVFFHRHRYSLIKNQPNFNELANSLNSITSLKTVKINRKNNPNFKDDKSK
jgi:hypothetical protein